jgi:DNA modification methylase
MDGSLNSPTANFDTLTSSYLKQRLNSPNDGVFHSNGNLFFTDPPYGFNYKKKSNGETIKNDGSEFAEVIKKTIQYIKSDIMYICGDFRTAKEFLCATESLGSPKSCIVWSKPIQHRMHRYEPCHELIWYFGNNGNPFYSSNVFNCKREINLNHPTVKPIELILFCFESHKNTKIVIDAFGGSGSTLIAAAQTKRRSRLVELDPKYCDVIRRRWTQYAKDHDLEVGTGGLE